MAVARRGAPAAADDQLLTLGEVKALLAAAGGAITGEVRALAGSAVPTGWLAADGSAISRTTYAALYTAIGTAHGTGDGSTTFNLPDLRGRVVAGVSAVASDPFQTLGAKPGEQAHTLALAEMPSHSHGLTDPGHTHTQNAHGHGVSDPGHGHGISDPQHNHGVYDNGHTHNFDHGHSIYDNGHSHGSSTLSGFMTYATTNATRQRMAAGTSSSAYAIATRPSQIDDINYGTTNSSGGNHGVNNTSGYNTGGGGGNHGNYSSYTGISINGNGTGVTVQNTTPTEQSAATGITMATAGSGTAHNVIQPSIALTYIVKT